MARIALGQLTDSLGTFPYKPEPHWYAPTLLNSWVNYGGSFSGAGYMKLDNGLVLLRGLIKDGTYGANLFTLPEGYRPEGQLIFRCQSAGGANRVDVKTTGAVEAVSAGGDGGSWLSLAGIAFYAVA